MPEEVAAVKSDGASKATLVAVVSLLAGLLGTGLGASLQGYFNTRLERQKFESSLIEKALDSNDQAEIAKRLTFMVDIGIIRGLDRSQIANYAHKDPAQLPTLGEAPWYVVLESLPGDDEGKALSEARVVREKTMRAGLTQSIQLYKTRISNNYAVVLGGPINKSEALALADVARKKFAPDSFAQQNRGWTFVKAEPF